MAKKRRVIRGMPISAGIALGRAQVILVGHLDVAEKPITASQVKAEIVALDKAVDITSTELRDLRDSASRKMSSSVSRVFDAQLLIATDQDFLKKVRIEIGVQRRNAGFVYYQMIKRTTHQLYLSNDPGTGKLLGNPVIMFELPYFARYIVVIEIEKLGSIQFDRNFSLGQNIIDRSGEFKVGRDFHRSAIQGGWWEFFQLTNATNNSRSMTPPLFLVIGPLLIGWIENNPATGPINNKFTTAGNLIQQVWGHNHWEHKRSSNKGRVGVRSTLSNQKTNCPSMAITQDFAWWKRFGYWNDVSSKECGRFFTKPTQVRKYPVGNSLDFPSSLPHILVVRKI